MLRKFNIKVDGKEYLVEMEEIGGVQQAAPVQQPVIPDVTQEVAGVTEKAISPESKTEAGADAMTAPMPGTVLKILVNPGESVVENQPILILEAMKMENEIVANKAGVVSGIHVAQGDMVNPGEALLTIS